MVAAFSKAIDELMAEGGIPARSFVTKRIIKFYEKTWENRIPSLYLEEKQSPIITTFLFPNEQFNFNDFYNFVKERGFVLYPGKLTDAETFQIGNIGEIYEEDILALCNVIEEYKGVVLK